jgi:hypothetical protein
MARQRVTLGPLLMSAALLILGAAVIHLSGASQQLPRSIVVAAGLCLVGLVQAAGAVALLSIARRPLVRALALFCAGGVFVWGVAHSAGLPLGTTLWRPEALSIPDFFLPAMEALGALLLARASWARRRPPSHRWLGALAILPALLLAPALAAGGVMDAVNDAWLPASGTLNVAAGETTTVAYCSPGGSPLAMDLTMPAATARRPVPVVVNTRSAGWFTPTVRQPASARCCGRMATS